METRKKIANLLKQNKQSILKNWKDSVREVNPSAKNQNDNALIDAIPEMLEKMIEVIPSETPVDALANYHSQHAEQRTHLDGYTLDQIINEYEIMAKVILGIMEENKLNNLEETKIVYGYFFSAIKHASTKFAGIREKNVTDISEQSIVNYNAIIDAVQDYAILTVDENGIITSWNSGAFRMKQYSREEAIGSNFSMLYTQEGRDNNEPMNHLNAARIEGHFRGEGLRRKKNGDLFLADVYIIPIWNKEKITGFAKIVEDLSEHNKLLQERDLSLIKAEYLKEENELRENFVASLTHDLRSPLSAAMASAELIMRDPLNQERNLRLSAKIVEHINRTDKLISNMLDANHLHTGEALNISPHECSMQKIINEVVEELATSHEKKIIINCPEDVMGLWDEDALRRIFENLINNAIKYGAPQTPITVTTISASQRVIVNVHNRGPVIELSDQQLLFEKFKRSKAAKESGEKSDRRERASGGPWGLCKSSELSSQGHNLYCQSSNQFQELLKEPRIFSAKRSSVEIKKSQRRRL